MRKAFLDGPGIEGWAFYGSPANTGDGIRMALRIGAALARVGSIAGRVICAIPERRHGLRIGMNTSGVGKPNEIVVDNHGRRYASERRITKDPEPLHLLQGSAPVRHGDAHLSAHSVVDGLRFGDDAPRAGRERRGGGLQRDRLGRGQPERAA